MALFDELPNIFLTQKPDYLQGLLNADMAKTGVDKYKQLEQQANISGLLNTFVNYIAQPKNQGYGSIIPYAAKSYLAGAAGAQNVYDTKAKNVLDALNVAKTTKQIEMEGMTELDKLIYNRKRLQETDPTSPYLSAYDAAIQQKASPYGSSVEGVSYNILLQGSGDSEAAREFRKTPKYAVAYREVFEPKTVVQTVQDPITGITKQVPVQIKPAAPPPNILPPEYGYSGAGTTTKTAATNAPVTDTNANVLSNPAAPTTAEYSDAKKSIKDIDLLERDLDLLEKHVNRYGVLPLLGGGSEGARQRSLYKNVMMKAKEKAKLGVLNVNDQPNLEAMINDPTDPTIMLKGGADAWRGSLAAYRDSLNQEKQLNLDLLNKANPKAPKKKLTNEELFKLYPPN